VQNFPLSATYQGLTQEKARKGENRIARRTIAWRGGKKTKKMLILGDLSFTLLIRERKKKKKRNGGSISGRREKVQTGGKLSKRELDD